MLANGATRAIEQLKVGDKVLARDEATGKTEAKTIKRLFKRQVEATLVLSFSNGDKIECTKEHPFYVEHKGFTPAGELGIGTSIVTRAGPSVKLEQVEVNSQPATVYNFEVEDFHSYFVGNSGLWVHNTCPFIKPTWGRNRIIKDLYDRGWKLLGPSREGGGFMWEGPLGDRLRIMPRPGGTPSRSAPIEKYLNRFYYRYSGPNKGAWGTHTTIPDK